MGIKNQKLGKPEIRYLNDMRRVLYDRRWAKTAPNFEVYYMYRGVSPSQIFRRKTWEGKQKTGLRCDITVIPPRMLGKEFVKTKGHEHSKDYSEIYIVLEGKATYLLQKYKDNKIEDVYAVKAKKGEAVIVPPHYGHVTINPAKVKLKEGNWLSKNCRNIYDLFIKKRGACYFAVAQKSRLRQGFGGQAKIKWVKNKNYKEVPELRFKKPLKSLPKNLGFLSGRGGIGRHR